jgi:glycosyltransferase involved in cell wall biosynthesis
MALLGPPEASASERPSDGRSALLAQAPSPAHGCAALELPGSPRVALVHDWLVEYAGAERVLARLTRTFPGAPVFTTVCTLNEVDRLTRLGATDVRTSFLQCAPRADRNLRYLLPLMPLAIEQHDLSSFDLVISNSHAVAKGVLVSPDALHLCYCHSPMRYAWDMQAQYLRDEGIGRGAVGVLARMWLHYMRIWDQRTAPGVDAFAANSAFIARRIERAYRRTATVIAPPVDTTTFSASRAGRIATQDAASIAAATSPQSPGQRHFVTASRLVPYKRIDLIVAAFGRMPDKRLIVIGDGPCSASLRASAAPNITFTGFIPDHEMRGWIASARGFVFAALEDFGIAPVEALACGTPVITYAHGGAAELVSGAQAESPVGLTFAEQTPDAIVQAIERFETIEPGFRPGACVERAMQFSTQAFDERLAAWVSEQWAARAAGASPVRT